MPRQKLTKSVVDRLAPAEHEIVVWDSALPGFGVRLKPNGAKSYVVQYRNRETGASRRKTIGQSGPLMTFHQAREQARLVLAAALTGGDPVDEARMRRKAPTVSDLAADYLEKHAHAKKRPACAAADEGMLRLHILPRIGKQKVDDVSPRDIHAIHVAMKATPHNANRVLSLLSKMFNLAIRWGWRADNPATGITRYHEEPRDRWLSRDELARLLAALDEHPHQLAANAIRFQLLTGARIGEVLKAEWKDIDVERGVWRKPSHHTKQKRTEHLPLSRPALTLVLAMREEAGAEPFLFPGDAPDKPLQNLKRFWKSVTKLAELRDYRIHDNRHTHASHLVSSGLSLEIVGRLLGHTNPATTRRYAHLADDPLRAAADRFGELVAAAPDASSSNSSDEKGATRR